jgi:NAD(P)-dependent dehydrogenase (short-subunit alcohol dehydrogenase family)
LNVLFPMITNSNPGANSGIGYDTAYALAKDYANHHVIIASRSPERGHKALAEIQSSGPAGTLSFLELDVTVDASIEAAVKQLTSDFGVIDVLVNNAGISPMGTPTRQALMETFNTNVFGPTLLSQAVEPLLNKSKDPRIINVTSELGSLKFRTDYSLFISQVEGADGYRMSKTALNMLTLTQAFNYRNWEKPPKVWSYCPGYVVTNLTGEADKTNRVASGAESSETSAQGILEIVRGDRDEDAGSFISKRGKVYPW